MSTALLFVGTYTEGTPSEGVYRFRLDADTGALEPLGPVDAGPNPSYLARHPTRPLLVVANEVGAWDGAPTGAVTALAFDERTGDTMPRGRRASGGAGPAYVSVDSSGRWALVANYGGGTVAALPLAHDGTLGEATSVVRHRGAGPDAARQDAPHAHCVVPDPSGCWVLAADLGADRIFVYRLDAAGTLVPAPEPSVAARPGAGPRHLAFGRGGEFLYATNELDLTLGTYHWDAAAGTLAHVETVPVLPDVRPGPHTAADLHVAPSGRFLYASVRGDDALAVHAIDPRTGRLTLVQRAPTEGRWPRSFALDASGGWLVVANQRSDDLTVFRVDADTGRVASTGERAAVPSPVCVRFVA